jgi:hypothetical protein
VLGLNVLNGGSGENGVRGTYDQSTVDDRWQMSPAEIERVGTVFALAPATCGLISWHWTLDFPEISGRPAQRVRTRICDKGAY